MSKCQFTFSALLAACLLANCVSAVAFAADELGIVADKPSKGPFVETKNGYMVPYSSKLPGKDVTFEMVPIPGGKFLLGSPAGETNRSKDEGPQIEVTVEPFWMGKYEVTWGEYKQFMALHDIFKDFQSHNMRLVTDDNMVDAITAPSNLYEPTFTFQFGEHPRQPAITMTQYAAKQYTKWLSIMTHHFYRLPSEAEWEYTCRAGTTTAYYFGDDPKDLGEYAWYYDNSEEATNQVGQKLPNAWGLYDMHGNAAEWALDAYTADGYAKFAGKNLKAMDAVQWPTTVFPRTLRGGSWEMDAEECRSAARLASSEDWKEYDPNFPQSPYWFTTSPATGVGFRIIRPLHPPKTRDQREHFWKADLPEIWEVVKDRIDNEGRGALGIVNQELPQSIEKLRALKKQ